MASTADGWSPFVFPHIWEKSFLLNDDQITDALLQPIDLDLSVTKLDNPYAPSQSLGIHLHLPSLDAFQFGSPASLVPSDASVASVEDQPPSNSKQGQQDDLWNFADDSELSVAAKKFQCWEFFSNSAHQEPQSGLLSEAGPRAFNAALRQYEKHVGRSKISRPFLRLDSSLEALWQLCLGRPSRLFSYDQATKSFRQEILHGSITSYSIVSSQSVFDTLIGSANSWVELRQFVENTYNSDTSCSALVAMASAVATIISTLESQLVAKRGTLSTLLQLQHHFQHSHETLRILKELVDVVAPAKTDFKIAALMFYKIQQIEQVDSVTNETLLHIFQEICTPWLRAIEDAVGLRSGRSSSFDQSKDWSDNMEILFGRLPSVVNDAREIDNEFENSFCAIEFITKQDKEVIEQTFKGFRYLEKHDSRHPLLQPESMNVYRPALELGFLWDDIERISQQAKAYQESLQRAMKCFKSDGDDIPTRSVSPEKNALQHPELYGLDEAGITQVIEDSITLLDTVPAVTGTESNSHFSFASPDSTSTAETGHHRDIISILRPPTGLIVSSSIMPIINVQSRFVNSANLQTLFQKYDLRKHLSLNHNFQLFGSGIFVSRLSSVLFDPDIATTERKRGVMRSGSSMGLRLGSGSRQTWPPASSELRLALMGILSESWRGASGKKGRVEKSDNLPGQLSFGIRDLPNDEIEQCLNVDSVQALDFLRLQYKTPVALQDVITDSCLEKYDRAFRFFVKLLRMTFAMNQWYSNSAVVSKMRHIDTKRLDNSATARRFCIEAQHLISTLCTHFFNTAVRVPWQRFQNQLDDIEGSLIQAEHSTLQTPSMDQLQQIHSETLDSILAGLLLRKRQQNAAKILEGIFADVLMFVRTERLDAAFFEASQISKDAKEGPVHEGIDIDVLYKSFKSKVQEFIDICQMLGEKAMNRTRSKTIAKDDASRSAVQLVQLLCLSGYHSTTIHTT